MKQTEGNRNFVKRMFYRFLIPSLATSFFLSLSNIVDSLVIGQRMQESGLAAVSLTLPIFMVYNVLDIALSTGGAMTYSQMLGVGNVKKARAHFTQTAALSLLLSLPFVLLGLIGTPLVAWILGAAPEQGEVYRYTLDYAQILLLAAPLFFLNFVFYEFIRVDDGEVRASVGFIAGTVADFTLNFVFVLGLGLGVRGAILATVAGQLISILIYLGHFLHPGHVLQFCRGALQKKELLQSFRLGFAGSSRYILQFIFLLSANQILIRNHGALGVAVFDLLLNVNYVAFSLFDGSLSTMQPLVTTFIGEHHFDAAKSTLKRALVWGSALTAGLLAVIGVFAPQICCAFGVTEAAANHEGTAAVRIFLIGVLFAGWNTLYAGFAQASGHEMLTFLMFLLRNLAVLLPCMFVFSLFGRLSVIWWMYPAAEIISMAVWMLAIKKTNSSFLDQTEDTHILRTGLGNDPKEIGSVIQAVEGFCEKWEASMKQSYYVTLTVEEICSAIILNAFDKQNRIAEENYIQLTLVAKENGDFELHLRDNAKSFNPFDMVTKQILNADSTEGLESIGILMVKQKAKQFFYRRYLGFNVLVITV